MTAIVAWLVGRGLSETLATWLARAALVVAVALTLLVGKCAYDRHVISQHDASTAAAVATGARAADHTADAADRERAAARAAQSADLQGAIDNATQAQPEAARRPVGPVTSGVVDELRRQQAAAARRR